MGRTKTPMVEKIKAQIMDLSNNEAVAIAEWLDLLIEVRGQELDRARKVEVKNV